MDFEDYLNAKRVAGEEYKQQLNLIAKRYAEANARAKRGDIVEDHEGVWVLEGVECLNIRCDNKPELVYRARRLTKNLEPHKVITGVMKVYDGNIKKIIKHSWEQ